MRSRLLAAAVAVVLAAGVHGALASAPPNEPPVLGPTGDIRAVVGTGIDLQLPARDPDGDALRWTASDLPRGAELDDGGRLRWTPAADQAGSYEVQVQVRDHDDAAASGPLVLRARHSAHPGLYVAMGDSVASGHGLELRDYLGDDACWRDGEDAYPARFLGADGGPSPLETLALVACSGHSSEDLTAKPVDGGPALAGQPGRMSQLAWAVATNPGLVSVTIGANDLGIGRPDRVVGAGGVVDHAVVAERLAGLRANLAAVLRTLVDATDARVIVSTYHNPTAVDANGVPGCRRSCFHQAAEAVVGALNDTVRQAAVGLPAGRVAVADVAAAFEGHGAPNGRGPDFLRDARTPLPIPALLGWAGNVHPYCADGHSFDRDPWVSAADCIHPNQAGARAYADAIGETWRTAPWEPG